MGLSQPYSGVQSHSHPPALGETSGEQSKNRSESMDPLMAKNCEKPLDCGTGHVWNGFHKQKHLKIQ
jgi:hypothetical protein